ncbi:MAG: hypothetical protein ACI85K_002743, partial [Hyphomicrobiaceae bacterium]
MPDSHGPNSQKPIDQFGKGGSGTLTAPAGHNH